MGTPTGTVTFTDTTTNTTLGTGTLNGGGQAILTTSSLATGLHTLSASYAGDTNFVASSGTLAQTVSRASTTTGVMSSLNPSTAGTTVTFTATVTPTSPGAGTPTGMVAFIDTTTGANLGTANLDANGQASVSTGSLDTGTHIIAATYAGDTNFAASNGSVDQTVSG
jgi:hypothetical protein